MYILDEQAMISMLSVIPNDICALAWRFQWWRTKDEKNTLSKFSSPELITFLVKELHALQFKGWKNTLEIVTEVLIWITKRYLQMVGNFLKESLYRSRVLDKTVNFLGCVKTMLKYATQILYLSVWLFLVKRSVRDWCGFALCLTDCIFC